jgi:hypothetical protein
LRSTELVGVEEQPHGVWQGSGARSDNVSLQDNPHRAVRGTPRTRLT